MYMLYLDLYLLMNLQDEIEELMKKQLRHLPEENENYFDLQHYHYIQNNTQHSCIIHH